MVWINNAATASRNAYWYDAEYAHTMVAGILRLPDEVLDRQLKYNHLESNLCQELQPSVKMLPLVSQLKTEALNRTSKGLGTTSALRIIIDYLRVLEEDEQCLDEFFLKWELQHSQYLICT